MVCGYPGCNLKFKNYKTRMAHKQIHLNVPRNSVVTDSVHVNETLTSNPPSDDNVMESLSAGAAQSEEDCFEVGHSNVNKEFFQAQFLLSLRAKNVPANIIESVMESTQTIAQSCVDDFASQIETHLKNKNIDCSDLDLNSLKQEASKCFEGLNTKWRQDKYFTENMDVIVPKKILLDASVCKDVGTRGSNPRTPIKHDSFYYVSLLDTLKGLCTNENCIALLMPLIPSSDDVIRGCFDGSLFEENPILSNNPDALAVVLYCDEVNLVDTASSRPVKYGMFYYTVLNIGEEHRSGLHAISLLMAVDYNLIVEYGMNQFVSVIVKDLLVLEDGLMLSNGNIIYGSVLAFMGDNLASHAVGGFKQGFTAFRICRYCYAISQDVQCKCAEELNLLRTPEQYDHQVEVLKSLENNQTQLKKKSAEFGLNHGSDLNTLPHFHVTKNLSPDPFHDLLEGCWAITVPRVLRKFCLGAETVLSLKDLNFRISEMDYGYSETRPTTISEQHLADNAGLHQTGSQMWSLVNILPIILEPLVDAIRASRQRQRGGGTSGRRRGGDSSTGPSVIPREYVEGGVTGGIPLTSPNRPFHYSGLIVADKTSL